MRKFSKYPVLGVAISAFTCATSATHVQSGQLPNSYPARPIRILVESSPGGGVDIMARAVAQKLTEKWDRSAIVDNRTGGGGVIAMELTAKATPDGYTLYGGGSQVVIATPLKKVPFDIRKVFAPIVQLTSSSYLLLVHPSLPVRSVKELIAYAQSKPGTLSYASAGLGSAQHLNTELFKSMAGGINVVHVPYRGSGQALTDLLGGHVQLMFTSTISGAIHMKSGRLRAIAVTSRQRMQAFPDLPTVSESGVPGFTMDNMYGLYAPAGVPVAIQFTINREVSRIMNSPQIKDRLAADGAEAALPSSPAEFKAMFDKEVDKWEKFINTSGIGIE
jgi:tripartite-type tricarboxylate transporter receptor subunit TctC